MPEPEVSTSTTTMLEEVQQLERDFYKKSVAYEFSNGRTFQDGNGPYVSD